MIGDDPCVYINFFPDAASDFEPEAWQDLLQRFGGEPAVALMANVSGRQPGDEQALEFVTDLLTRFSGFAQDEYSEHLWSLEELRAGHQISGHRFFDYHSWYAESRKARTDDVLSSLHDAVLQNIAFDWSARTCALQFSGAPTIGGAFSLIFTEASALVVSSTFSWGPSASVLEAHATADGRFVIAMQSGDTVEVESNHCSLRITSQ